MTSKPKQKVKLVCYCHAVPVTEVQAAIERGCHKVDQVSDATTAGIGACGGTCRPTIQKMIQDFLKKPIKD